MPAAIHNKAFGGNTFACIAAIETLSVTLEDRLPERARALGEYILSSLLQLKEKHKIITDVRGRGLLIGIELGGLNKYPGNTIKQFMTASILAKLLKEHRIVCGFASNNPSVLKIQPPLIVAKDEIDYFIKCLDNVLKDEKGEFSLALDSIINAGKAILE